MPVVSGQKKTRHSLNNEHGVPNWKTILLEKKRLKNDHPHWKLEIVKRKREYLNKFPNYYNNLYDTKKSYHSSVPCLTTFRDEHWEVNGDIDEKIVPIKSNPIVILDQEKKKSMGIEDKNDFMIKKLSQEICGENLLDGEVEYGKGFVGKLLKKFNSLVNINNFDKNVRISNILKNDNRKWQELISSAAKRNKGNNSSAAMPTSSRGTTFNVSNSKLSNSHITFQCCSAQSKNKFVEELVSLPVSTSEINDGNIFEDDCTSNSDFKSLSDPISYEEVPRQDQVKNTKLVFENNSAENIMKYDENMKSFNHLGTNSKFYGSKSLNIPSGNGSPNSKRNLPDILLSTSPVKPLMDNLEDKESSFNVPYKTKASLGNDSEIKENCNMKCSSMIKYANNSVSSKTEVISSTSTSILPVKSCRPGTLVVRPSSNTPVSLFGCAPYKDIRISNLNDSEGNKKYVSKKSNISPSKPLGNIDISNINSVNGFGPESFVVSGHSSFLVTNVDDVFLHSKDNITEKSKLISNANTKSHNQIDSIESLMPHTSETTCSLGDSLNTTAPSSHAKLLLLDPPKLGSTNEEEIEPREESLDVVESSLTFLGAGVVHCKSALAKSKCSKRKSVTFLDPKIDVQIFEYPAEDLASYVESSNDFIKPSSINFNHLSSYRSKTHVDFEFGLSVQEEGSNVAINGEVINANENYSNGFPSNIPMPWSGSMSVDLMF